MQMWQKVLTGVGYPCKVESDKLSASNRCLIERLNSKLPIRSDKLISKIGPVHFHPYVTKRDGHVK